MGLSSMDQDLDQVKISVILPIFGEAHLLKKTLETLSSQEHKNIECIVVDSSESQVASNTIAHWQCRMHLKRYRIPKAHVADSYNRGATMAKGDYLLFMSPGDEFLSLNSLSQLLHLAASNFFPDLVYGSCRVMRRGEEPISVSGRLDNETLKQGKLPTSLSSSLIKRDFFRKIEKFDARLNYCIDLDLFARCCKHPLFQYANITSFIVDHHEPTLTAKQLLEKIKEVRIVLARHFGYICAALGWWQQDPISAAKDLWKRSKQVKFGDHKVKITKR